MAPTVLWMMDIHRQHCKLGRLSRPEQIHCAWLSSPTRLAIPTTDHAVRGSTTYLPNAEGRCNSATSAVAPSAAPAEEEADGEEDALYATTMATLMTRDDDGLNVIVNSGLDAIKTTLALARKRSQSAITPDDLTATVAPQPALPLLPPPPPPPSRTGAINLRATPTSPRRTMARCITLSVVAIAHERAWVARNPDTIRGNVTSGSTYNIQWYHIGPTGERIGPSDREFQDMFILESFLHMMPPKQLQHILQLTNVRLVASDRQQLTRQELLRFIGVCTLILTINFRGATFGRAAIPSPNSSPPPI
jgi:hypothetical protein